MKSSVFGSLLLFTGLGLLGWATYDYFANAPVTADNCGVTVMPTTRPATATAFTVGRVPLNVVNRSGGPIRIVGNNAC